MLLAYYQSFMTAVFTQKAKMTDFDRYKVMKAKKMVSI